MAPKEQTSTKPTLQNKNVAGGLLALFNKGAGAYKDGYCRSGDDDNGNHSIAATVTSDFLSSSYGSEAKSRSVKDGDKTCLSAQHFADAIQAADQGKLSKEAVPRVHLHASHDKALDVVSYKTLKRFAAEPEAPSQQNRQESHINPSSGNGAVKESKDFGGDHGTTAPGRGKSHNKSSDPANTTGQRG